jgi:hypothetical protein
LNNAGQIDDVLFVDAEDEQQDEEGASWTYEEAENLIRVSIEGVAAVGAAAIPVVEEFLSSLGMPENEQENFMSALDELE